MWLQKDRSSTHSIMIILYCNYKTQCSNEPYLYSNQRQKDVTRSTLQEFSTDIKEHLNQYGDDPPSRRILTKIVNQVTKNIPLGIDIPENTKLAMNKNGKISTAFVANNKNKIRFEAIATLHKKSSSESHSHIPQQLGWVGKCTGLQVAEQQMLWVFRPRQCTGNGKKSAAMVCDLHQVKCSLWHTSDVACACPEATLRSCRKWARRWVCWLGTVLSCAQWQHAVCAINQSCVWLTFRNII